VIGDAFEVRSVAFLEAQVGEPKLLRPLVASRDQIGRDIDA
jgi:hypothetical protein